MVPPFLSTSLFPIRTSWAPKHPLHHTLLRTPPSATPSTAVLLHHAGADTPTPSSITRDRPLSSTASDRDPCILSSRFIPTVVHLAGAAPTTVSSTAPRRHRLPPRSASTPPTAIATAAPSNSQQMRTRRRTRGGTLSYLLNLFIAAGKYIATALL